MKMQYANEIIEKKNFATGPGATAGAEGVPEDKKGREKVTLTIGLSLSFSFSYLVLFFNVVEL